MSWEKKVKQRIQTGNTYTMSNIGKVKVVGSISQYGGEGSGGALFVECIIIESTNSYYKVGSTHELNAEFMI